MLRRLPTVLALCALGVSAGCVSTPSLSGPEEDLAHDALASAMGLADYLQAVTPETVADVTYGGPVSRTGNPLEAVSWTSLRFAGGGWCTVTTYASREAAREAGKTRCAGFYRGYRPPASRRRRGASFDRPDPTGQVCYVYGAQAAGCALPGRSAAHLGGALRALVKLDAQPGVAALPGCEAAAPVGPLAALTREAGRGHRALDR